MGKSFRWDDLNHGLLLPPWLHDWLPENRLVRFLVDVVETLDLSAIPASCGQAQIMVAVGVIQQTTENHQFAPMVERTERNVGARPQAASADTGYWNPQQVEKLQGQGVDLHVASGKQRHRKTSPPDKGNPVRAGEERSLRERMKRKLLA